MEKPTEKQLYVVWLDLTYALGISEDYIHDAESDLKYMLESRDKIKKLLKQTSDQYKSIYDKEPKKRRISLCK